MTALRAACLVFPLLQPHAVDVAAALEALRGRFKAVCAQLGVAQSYVCARGGAAGSFSATGAPGEPDCPPEGRQEEERKQRPDLTF